MLYGMTPNEYWNASPLFARAYRQKHKLEIEQKNQELWLQGLYIYDAFSVVIANAFGKKGSKTQKYLDKPVELFPKPKENPQEITEKETQSVIDTLNAWAVQWNTSQGGDKSGNQSRKS